MMILILILMFPYAYFFNFLIWKSFHESVLEKLISGYLAATITPAVWWLT